MLLAPRTILSLACILLLAASSGTPVKGAASRTTSVAVLDLGGTEPARRAADGLAQALATDGELAIIDRGLGRAAAHGVGYTGSLNMTMAEARDLGAAIGCDFFITGAAATLRRSPSTGPVYYESYAALFIVSARTGQLIMWERPNAQEATMETAEAALLAELRNLAQTRYAPAILKARAVEKARAAPGKRRDAVEVEDLSEENSSGRQEDHLRLPQPYRRLRPPYPETAARSEIEATVDALVEIGTDGEVAGVEIVRWAGFGLDEAVIATIRQMHFRPASRNGVPVASRVLLRYNFRRPPKTNAAAERKR